MFGKNYDEEILKLNKRLSGIAEIQNKNTNDFIKMINDIQDIINKFEKSIVEIAKIQKSHKEAIMMLSKR